MQIISHSKNFRNALSFLQSNLNIIKAFRGRKKSFISATGENTIFKRLEIIHFLFSMIQGFRKVFDVHSKIYFSLHSWLHIRNANTNTMINTNTVLRCLKTLESDFLDKKMHQLLTVSTSIFANKLQNDHEKWTLL